jgi:hypothetical protein
LLPKPKSRTIGFLKARDFFLVSQNWNESFKNTSQYLSKLGTFTYARPNPYGCQNISGVWSNNDWVKGKCYFANGEVHIGIWTKGKQNGKGSIIYDNNSTFAYYDGHFEDDSR